MKINGHPMDRTRKAQKRCSAWHLSFVGRMVVRVRIWVGMGMGFSLGMGIGLGIGLNAISHAHAASASPGPLKSPSPRGYELQKRLTAEPSIVGCFGSLKEPDEARCKKMEETLRIAKSLDLESPADFVSVVSARIQEIHDAQSYDYTAVLLAALSHDRRFTPSLEKLAAIEKKWKIRFTYGEAALERLRDGHCSEETAKRPNLGEVCRYEDPDFNRLRHYTGAR